ncbi:MAG: metal-dependent transcriptional regulator [Planctomycetes bacterium]|nr:metal-dependent transcriptional regulator [Planctomycetota bacterium]
MTSLTIENYIKAVYQICARCDKGRATTGELADRLGVAPGTVTSMLKTLADAGLAVYAPYEGAGLTEAGRLLALRVLRRHRLIELFLATTLELSWDEVHDEAEHMEHSVSDLLVDRIDRFLGFPAIDPHGDPIPKADGSLAPLDGLPLARCELGAPQRLVRVLDQSSEFLRYLSDIGLSLATAVRVTARWPEAGVLMVAFNGRESPIAIAAAEKLLVAAVE